MELSVTLANYFKEALHDGVASESLFEILAKRQLRGHTK